MNALFKLFRKKKQKNKKVATTTENTEELHELNTEDPHELTNFSRLPEELPEELIFEILSRLPAKTLIQYKTVSKHWKSLIETPLFARSQLRLSKKQFQVPLSPHLLNKYDSSFVLYLDRSNLLRKITTEELRSQNVPLSTRHDDFMTPGKYVLLTSCDGIMCIHLPEISYLCLLNPTIDKIRYVLLPDNSIISKFYFAGFGYASSINDYKIVLAVQYKGGRNSICVYSLRRNHWRELDVSSCYSILLELGCFTSSSSPKNAIRMDAVVMNDALHWVKGSYVYNKHTKFFLYKFDMVNDCFEKVVDLNKLDNIVDDDDELAPRQTEIGVTENNTLVVYKLYSKIHISNKKPVVKRDVIKVWEMVDQHDYYSWKTKFMYQGRFDDDIRDDHDLVRVANNGNVLIIGETDNRFYKVTATRGYDRDKRNVPSYAPYYVPSLISPSNF